MRQSFLLLLVVICFAACRTGEDTEVVNQVKSPSEAIAVNAWLTAQGQPAYHVTYQGKTVIDTSLLGFELRDAPALSTGWSILSATNNSHDETWEMPWGEQREVRNHYNELRMELQEAQEPGRRLAIVFRAFDDGIGFRYEFPEWEGVDSLLIMDELTEFNIVGDPLCWWQPGDWDIYEHLYNTTRFSEIDAISKRDHPNLAQTYIPENAVNTPVTLRTDDSVYLSFHEAALFDYADMTLRVDKEGGKFTAGLVAWPDGVKVRRELPFNTPWRTIQITDRAGQLIESKLIVNLNEPSVLEDVSWVQPMKYAGIWWEMHLNKSTWDMASGKHGATTENAKRYIDFCAANGLKGLLIEGWNTGWERWIGFEDREGVFDFVTPYADYDIEEVVRYAKEKGVNIIMHHETSSAPRTYEQQLDTAFALCQRLGIHAVKTGYVGKIIPKGQYHHGQWMVRHYQKVVETAAKYQVAVNAHEPIKATGIRRTWPNFVAREGLRGQEFNAWSQEGGNPTEHPVIVAFTRMLGGPIDYTPGIFNLSLKPWKEGNRVKHTLAQELALYVVLYGPLQMAADLPENYADQPAFQFIRDVAVDWEQSRVLNGEPGDFVTIARQERGGSGRWFLGAITDENARTLQVSLDFLDPGKTYRATFYTDAADANWETNPTAVDIEQKTLTREGGLTLSLVAGGGAAVVFEVVE